MLTHRENYLRALTFQSPEWIPIVFEMVPAVWLRYGESLEALVLRHPDIFPDVRPGIAAAQRKAAAAPATFRDDWGCGWQQARPGTLGQVVEHPLAEWSGLASLRPPDPAAHADWPALQRQVEEQRQAGKLVIASYNILQGGFFDRLQFLRGLENLLVDFLEEPPELARLIEIVLDYNLRYLDRWLEISADVYYFHGDIGTQRGLMFSVDTFRRHLKPSYRELFSRCRKAGGQVWYSSDGRMVDLVDELIDCGVTLHDPQLGPQSAEEIAHAYNGRLCTLVDLNEQRLPVWTPTQIRAGMRDAIDKIGDPRGGMMLYIIPSEDVPLENIEALCTAWEEFR